MSLSFCRICGEDLESGDECEDCRREILNTRCDLCGSDNNGKDFVEFDEIQPKKHLCESCFKVMVERYIDFEEEIDEELGIVR